MFLNLLGTDLLNEIGHIAFTDFIFIAVENTPPYAVALYKFRYNGKFLRLGYQIYQKAMLSLNRGRENDWPGYTEDIRELEPPAYAENLWII